MNLKFLLTLLIYIPFQLTSQNIPTRDPDVVGLTFDFSEEFISKFNSPEAFNECQKVYQKMDAEGRNWKQLTTSEREILKYCNEIKEDVWDVVGGGCSWYCGGGPKLISASSYLKSQGSNSYVPQNAHDLNYRTAWVEGVDGYGIGEYLEYTFDPASPRITKIIIANGYIKSPEAYNQNSRVKKLRVYYNNTPIADLNLEDIRANQHFEFDPIGYGDRTNLDDLQTKDPWKLKFEIIDVYKGSKYSDTVISEIYFDGIDVH